MTHGFFLIFYFLFMYPLKTFSFIAYNFSSFPQIFLHPKKKSPLAPLLPLTGCNVRRHFSRSSCARVWAGCWRPWSNAAWPPCPALRSTSPSSTVTWTASATRPTPLGAPPLTPYYADVHVILLSGMEAKSPAFRGKKLFFARGCLFPN
jgi:hypothetical protein